MELPKTMELPKNIVQIGKPDPTHKIFVEDYVISYMKQWNKHGKRDTGIILYGKRMAEGDCRFYFVYGASYMSGVEARAQYITEEEREMAEEIRAEHFPEYELLGWGELRGEMPEGFYMREHNKGIWVRGYACFFEKNDSMLSFMVTDGAKELEGQPSVLHRETQQSEYIRESNIDARMEERNRKLEQIRQNQMPAMDKLMREMPTKEKQNGSWKNGAMVMALVVCVVAGLVLTDEGKRKNLEAVAGNIVATAMKEATRFKDEQVESLQASGEDNSLLVESTDTSNGMLQATSGNQGDVLAQGEVSGQDETQIQTGAPSQGEIPTQDADLTQVVVSTQEITQPQEDISKTPGEQVAETDGEATTDNNVQEEQEVVAKYVSYTIQKGDTLLDICRRECGTEALLKQVCQLNGIENADDIKIGQIILLPE